MTKKGRSCWLNYNQIRFDFLKMLLDRRDQMTRKRVKNQQEILLSEATWMYCSDTEIRQ